MTGPRVAIVVATTAGGTGRHAAMLAAGCAQRGMPVSVLGPAAARRFFAGTVGYIPVEIAERPRPVRDAAAVLRLSGLLSRGRPDVVHAHGLRAAAAASLALALTPRRPEPRTRPWSRRPARPARPPSHRPALLVTVHNAAPSGAFAAALYRALERLAARRADAVLCVSPDLTERMRRAGARDVRLAVIAAPDAPAPPAGAVASARAGLGAPGHPVILGVGRLAPQKGFDVLVDAVARLRNREPRPLLAIAGEGPLAGPLAARAGAGGAEARFLGARSDVPALLAAADVVAVPSRWEGQPLVVAEALRAGRPVVASLAGGIPVLTGEDAALLVPPADPGALAAAIASVLDDPALASRLGEAAAARARSLPSAADAVDAAAGVYAGLTAARSLPRRS